MSPFVDVPTGAFYQAPVDWAFSNGITTGKDATHFAPNDQVTRGESVTFLKRYHDNIVQPADAALGTRIDGLGQTVGGLSCGAGQTAKFDGTTWACGTDVDTTIPNTDALAGLSCGSGQTAKFDGTTWACGTDVDTTIPNTDALASLSCASSEVAYFNGVNWVCSAGKLTRKLVAGPNYSIDTAGTVGLYSSMMIGKDNLPLVAYYDVTATALKIAHCTVIDCSSTTVQTLDAVGLVGNYGSVVQGSDGFPFITYYDASNTALKAVHCTSVDCSFAPAAITLESTNSVGQYTAVAVGSDGFPVVSYFDSTNTSLRLYHCTNVSCSVGVATAIPGTGTVGLYSSIAIGTDGFPILAYFDVSNGNLLVYHCLNLDCSSGGGRTAEFAHAVGYDTSVVIGSDGFPLIAHHDNTSFDLRVYHCTAIDCSTGSGTAVVSAGLVGAEASVVVGADNMPVISYYNTSTFDAEIVQCTAIDCTTAKTPVVVDSVGAVGRYTSLKLRSDNNLILSYFDITSGDLKAASIFEAVSGISFG